MEKATEGRARSARKQSKTVVRREVQIKKGRAVAAHMAILFNKKGMTNHVQINFPGGEVSHAS